MENFLNDASSVFQMKNVQIGANCIIKTIYTSDNLYQPENFPKEMSFRLGKFQKYEEIYNFIFIYNEKILQNPLENLPIKINKENLEANSNNNQLVKKEIPTAKTIIKKKNSKAKSKEDEIALEKLKISPQIKPEAFNSEIPKEFFKLTPTPIMKFLHLEGYSGKENNLKLINESTILFCCGNTLILMDLDSHEQFPLFGQNSIIKNIAFLEKGKIIVSSDDSEIFFWNSIERKRIGSFQTHFIKIICIDVG